MVGREDYFLLNKASDFERGFCLNMEIAGGGIRPAGATMATKGIFVSRLLDSRREQMNWHRLTLVEKSRAEGAFRLGIYTSDERTFVHDGVNLD
ncbi:MAG: hypothetical protein IJV04_03175, partial [Lachnospiraceae bacterium]|nr:hypothetical protein [Lachnospiraceae bacterium]